MEPDGDKVQGPWGWGGEQSLKRPSQSVLSGWSPPGITEA